MEYWLCKGRRPERKKEKVKKTGGGGVIECLCPPQIHVEVLNPSVMILGGEAFWDMIRS